MFDLGWGAHTKYRIDPGFYNVVVNVLVNLDKWKSLRPDQRAFLERMAGWLEEENVRWVAERKAADDRKIKEAGIQIVDLGPNHRKLAYDAYWDALLKRAPEPTKELKSPLRRASLEAALAVLEDVVIPAGRAARVPRPARRNRCASISSRSGRSATAASSTPTTIARCSTPGRPGR